MRKKSFNFSRWWILPIGLILAIIIAGSLVTYYVRSNARQEIIRNGDSSALTVSTYINLELKKIEGAVQSLAGSPWILPALISRKDQDIEHANSVLDRYTSALDASVSYLMDTHGKTLASSNRNDPDSFVGKSYSFRPYFQEAIKGKPGHYFALGITSGKRGFYAGFPVKDRQGKIMGVVAIKKDLDELEIVFDKYPYCFFINRSGIIFLSSKPQMVFKSLWPVDAETRAALMASKQFGNQPFGAIFQKEIADGMDVVLEGSSYLVSRKVIDQTGWSVVILNPADPVNAYIYISVMTTVSACLFVMIFSGIIYFVDRSRRNIKQGEERFRELFNSMNSGVVVYEAVDDGHDFLFKDFNRAAEIIDHISKGDVIGKSVIAVFPAVKEFGLLEVFQEVWKTGIPQSHPVSQYKDSRIEGWRENYVYKLPSGEIVAIYDDVTEKKKLEEEIFTLSITDPLTGLNNRRGFLTLAEQQLKLSDRTKNGILLFFSDLDGLKWINDTLGHEEGDQAIIEAASVLKETFRTSDIVARMGGDEFAVLAIDPEEINPGIIINRLQNRIDMRNNQANRQYKLSISVGCSSYDPENPSSIDELMASADKLMYEQKKGKRHQKL